MAEKRATNEAKPTDSKGDLGLTCAICIETYQNPKLLGCSHTFCELCIKTYLEKLDKDGKLKNGIECPVCRESTPIDKRESNIGKWVKSLPANYALISVMDAVLDKDEKAQSTQIKCQPCDQSGISCEATIYCPDCNEYLCEDCTTYHKKFAATRKHKSVCIKDLKSGETYSKTVRQYEMCKVHSKRIKFVCVNHNNQRCCSTCVIITHSDCKEFKEIKEFPDQTIRQSMSKVKNEAIKLQDKMKSTATFCRNQENKLDEQGYSIIQEIERVKQKMVKLFDKLKQKAKVYKETLRKKKTAEYQTNIDLCEKMVSSLEEILVTQEVLLQHGSSTQIFITAQILSQQLEEHEKEMKKKLVEIEITDLSLSSSDLIQKMFDLDEDLMKLSEATSVMGVEKISDYRCVQLELLETTEIVKSESDEKFPFITGMTYLSDVRLIAVDTRLLNYLVFDDKNKLLNKASLHKRPGGVVSHADDTIAVAELTYNTIGLYSITADNKLQRTSTVSTTVPCFSISLTGKGKYVVGTFDGNKPACLISENGEVVNINAKFPDRQYGVNDTMCVYIPDSGKLVLTVRDDNTVHVYDTRDGTEVVVRDDRIKNPGGVAVSESGCIFVCSRDTNSIVQISQAGEVIGSHTLGSMENPYCICISRDGKKLAVANNIVNKNKRLQTFYIR